jgi:hypothetical protein
LEVVVRRWLVLGLWFPAFVFGSAFADAPPPGAANAAAVGPAAITSYVTRDMEALWYRDEPDKTRKYGTTKIRATLLPNPERDVRVGVLEEYAGATGLQWRTSVWVASFIAATSLNKELTEFRYDIAAGGFIDGPSAGALMAVGFMAAMTGDTIRGDSTMTGALAPDGSVVSVGGIPEKVRAANAVGKKRVGIPAGQATATAAGSKEVNCIELGKELGVEVVELADIFDAYEFMTGKKLPRLEPAVVDKLALPAGVAALLQKRAAQLVDQAKEDIALAAGDPTRGVKRFLALAKIAAISAGVYIKKDEGAAAYVRAGRAASLAKAAVRVAALGGNEKYEKAAGSVEGSSNEIDKFEKELDQSTKESKAAPMVILAGYGALARARGFLEVARTLLGKALQEAQKVHKSEERTLKALQASGVAFIPALYMSYADQAVDMGRELLANNPGELATPLKFDGGAALRTARALVSAASGNVEYIDALLLKDVAEQKKMSIDEVRIRFATNERSYLLASRLSQAAVQRGLDGQSWLGTHLARLEKAAASYVESALVITKYYSLDADVNEKNPSERVRRDKALEMLLRRAELGAREAAAVAIDKLGVVPPEAALYYQAGTQEGAKGHVRNKLRALRSYWRSNIASRVAAMVMTKP